MKTREEMIKTYTECYPMYSQAVIEAMVACYFDGFRDAVKLELR